MVKLKIFLPLFIILLSAFISVFIAEQVLALLKYPSEFILRSVHPPLYSEHKKTIDFEYEFTTNSQGLRYKEISLNKPFKTYRIFVVGDSFVEGVGVEESETIPELLEKNFTTPDRQVNFLNGGLSGTGPFEYGRALFNVGLKYNIDAVLICLYANDLVNTPATAKPEDIYDHQSNKTGIKALLHYLLPRTYTLLYRIKTEIDYNNRINTNDLVATVSEEAKRRNIPQKEINAWRERLPDNLLQAANDHEFNGSILAYGLLEPNYWTTSLDIDTPQAELQWQAMVAILTEIVEHSRDLGLEVGIVYFPDRLQYDSEFNTNNNLWQTVGVKTREEWLIEESEAQKRLKSWARKNELAFLDLTSTFKNAELQTNAPLTWKYDHHWTVEGNRIAAKAIGDWLKTNHLFFLHN